MANDIYDVLPSSMLIAQLDSRFITNGTPYVFIDGDHIPGARNPRYTAGQPTLNPLTLDARLPPEVELRSFGGYGEIGFSLTTEQANALSKCIGMGAVKRTAAQINADRIVGDPTQTIPSLKTHGMFCIMRLDVGGVGAPWEIEFDRLPFTNISTVAGDVKIWVKTKYWHLVTDSGIVGTQVITDPFIGNIDVTTMQLVGVAPALITYDASTAYTVTIGGDTIGVDYLDPQLIDGCMAALFCIAFKWGQLSVVAGHGDYSIVEPYEAPVRRAIDFIECLGDAPGGKIWNHKRFMWCEQVNLPDYAANADSGAARETEFKFRVKPYSGRFLASSTGGGASYFRENDYIILP